MGNLLMWEIAMLTHASMVKSNIRRYSVDLLSILCVRINIHQWKSSTNLDAVINTSANVSCHGLQVFSLHYFLTRGSKNAIDVLFQVSAMALETHITSHLMERITHFKETARTSLSKKLIPSTISVLQLTTLSVMLKTVSPAPSL